MSDMNNLDGHELKPSVCTSRWPFLLVVSLMLFASSLFLSAGQAFADPFFNSSEPGCDGSDPNVLWCDDFEDGDWAQTDSMGARGNAFVTSNPETYASNDGWVMDVYYPTGGQPNQNNPGKGYPSTNPATGPNYALCGGQGVAGTNCAAKSGPRVLPSNSSMMGMHSLKGRTNYNEVYLRWYVKPSSDFQWGHEKTFTFNPCCLQFGIILGDLYSLFGHGIPTFLVYTEGQKIRTQNMNTPLNAADAVNMHADDERGGKLSYWWSPGNWHAMQLHFKSDTNGSNGVLEMWADNCGPNGLECTGVPTKRMSYTDVNWQGKGLGTLWLENWSNPLSHGDTSYDQFKASTVGPIPFSGVTNDKTPPAAPNNLQVQ
jgi:hypothetical protein